jgi:hypothetical protein
MTLRCAHSPLCEAEMEESIRELWMSGDVSTRICRTDWRFRSSLSHPLLPVIIDGNRPIQRKRTACISTPCQQCKRAGDRRRWPLHPLSNCQDLRPAWYVEWSKGYSSGFGVVGEVFEALFPSLALGICDTTGIMKLRVLWGTRLSRHEVRAANGTAPAQQPKIRKGRR